MSKPSLKAIPKSKRSLAKGKQIGLRSKPEGKLAWDRLPFVGKDHSKYASCWDVPMSGGFFGGIAVGESIARMYLKYVRTERGNPVALSSTLLSSMLASLAAKQPTTEDEEYALKGQRTGFLSELSNWIETAVDRLGSNLDAIPEQSFVQQANEHLTRTDAALMAAIESRGAK
ncbi:hypothetical protein [Pseudomonas sp. PD9R]|uniref:hypothetical protein n=1 Tax=Pseudomonas sp. PD9R TaxID=2853534 RepID=UPI001C46B94C|nr:hypothetical protein [Pseudomonas sp. PD9R]MBV6823850.1 hypothetical protein [Pseudomonas sp. PD9R]